jgi:mRNA deadenylase 3'-5' endonuclease subunit Ccr4
LKAALIERLLIAQTLIITMADSISLLIAEMDLPDGTIKRSWSPATKDMHHPLLRVMSYNILDDCFICQNKYRYCPQDKLYLSGRHDRIVAEIAFYNPDVVCLQEVTHSHFEKNLLPDLKKHGYSGFHMSFMRTKDGLAMFYKRETVQVLEKKTLHTLNNILKHVQVIIAFIGGTFYYCTRSYLYT